MKSPTGSPNQSLPLSPTVSPTLSPSTNYPGGKTPAPSDDDGTSRTLSPSINYPGGKTPAPSDDDGTDITVGTETTSNDIAEERVFDRKEKSAHYWRNCPDE